MSLLPDRATALLSPCRLTGCRVTDRSSQDARRQPEDTRSVHVKIHTKMTYFYGVEAAFQTKTVCSLETN